LKTPDLAEIKGRGRSYNSTVQYCTYCTRK